MSETNRRREGWIELATQRRGRDRTGREHLVTRIEVKSRGYIPDVYVRMDHDVLDEALYDDDAFVAFVNQVLNEIGYSGRPFDRAELGLQGRNYIVLEPGREFRAFVVQRFGWCDLAAPPRVH
ncbi:hypothetical protein RA210_U10447 [Rubrivivax sp. A210]|uniref:hypothetical protein n=1 Tax=Rubrivivax sp. A210 TaxID=2772301 RepID=UPI0019192E8A|nr:hypothetical protein [Rubrivivax sp. A210]CAD5366681.1 hypothetical protein RA210_U10447 [Rubrivivax sp. A210]